MQQRIGANTADTDKPEPLDGPRGGTSFLDRFVPHLLAVAGAIGFVAATVLTIEKIELLQNADYTPSCSIGEVLDCGSVMVTPQADALGFPNPLLGIGGFAIVLTIGVAALAGARFRPWFWIGLQFGALFGVLFVHWLIYQSIYAIGALCPYCMVVWAVTIPIFVYTTAYNLRHGHIDVAPRAVTAFLGRWHAAVAVGWLLLVAAAVAHALWTGLL